MHTVRFGPQRFEPVNETSTVIGNRYGLLLKVVGHKVNTCPD